MNSSRNSFIARSGGIVETCLRGVGDFGVRELAV